MNHKTLRKTLEQRGISFDELTPETIDKVLGALSGDCIQTSFTYAQLETVLVKTLQTDQNKFGKYLGYFTPVAVAAPTPSTSNDARTWCVPQPHSLLLLSDFFKNNFFCCVADTVVGSEQQNHSRSRYSDRNRHHHHHEAGLNLTVICLMLTCMCCFCGYMFTEVIDNSSEQEQIKLGKKILAAITFLITAPLCYFYITPNESKMMTTTSSTTTTLPFTTTTMPQNVTLATVDPAADISTRLAIALIVGVTSTCLMACVLSLFVVKQTSEITNTAADSQEIDEFEDETEEALAPIIKLLAEDIGCSDDNPENLIALMVGASKVYLEQSANQPDVQQANSVTSRV